MIRGSCLCNSVRWEIDGPVGNMSHCHCSICRKAHGAPFATYLSTGAQNYRLVAGTEVIKEHGCSPRLTRAFCATCGSVVPMMVGARAVIPAGCLNDDPGIRPDMHIFTGSKAPWHAIDDNLPQHDAYPAEVGLAASPMPARQSETPGRIHGSCLCGGVAFEISAPFDIVHNCHCRRCRKARAAAHTTNGFLSSDAFHFRRGADLLDRHQVPEARSFAQSFCRVCGSGMPSPRPDTGKVAIPLGCLDGDPGQGADDHIFTGSKAPWYEITDGLPRFHEMSTPGF
ncbi:MAG: GFA family protein [Alphaproteobacteria bacterium]